MPNLVGIGNTQVPTNAMLGGLAYQDSIGEIDIDKIKAKVSDSAKAIFVYDTRKDSDGGAWRHRTQNLSWYNEGVNERRGARKEFPSVAVIVSEDTPDYKVTIYDGDDPNLSMWMQWIYVTNDPFLDYSDPGSHHLGNYAPLSLSAMNGIVCVGTLRSAGALSNLNAGLREFHFIKDECFATNNDKRVVFPTSIAHRNVVTTTYRQVYPNAQIVNSNVNDVAMTVLPNAPIDESTGLPIPTIAVATDGGVSVIKDDGSIFDTVATTSGYVASRKVEFSESGEYLYIIQDPSLIYSYKTSAFNIDRSSGTLAGYAALSFFSGYVSGSGPASDTKLARGNDITINIGHANTGLALLYPDYAYTSNGLDNASNKMICRVTKDFNTGWMIGNTVVSTLSSTEVGINTSGANIFQNGTFDSDISGWQNWDANRGTVTYNNGRMRFNNSGTGDVYAVGSFDHTVPPGTIITVSGNYYSISGGNATMVQIYPYNGDTNTFPNGAIGSFAGTNGTNASSSSFSGGADGTFHITTTVTSHGGATAVLLGLDPNVSTIFELDNLTCTYTQGRLSDHTTNGQDYVTFGSVTKTPVADGAELMAFGNFSSSNYIRAGTNSNLEMGSGDFHYIFWVNPNNSSSGKVLLSHWSYNVDSSVAGRVGIYFNSGNVRLDLGDDNTSSGQYQAITGANRIQNSNEWHMVCAIRRGNTAELWVDGKLDASQVLGQYADGTYSNKKRIVEIGYSPGMGSPDDGIRMALLRIGKNAPTKERIKKMYNDEKCLYHKNAKCTLHGTSDEIKGLGFDDINDILHVGTSSGRSEFQGLNRINNTTTAVTTAISASNGLVAEQ